MKLRGLIVIAVLLAVGVVRAESTNDLGADANISNSAPQPQGLENEVKAANATAAAEAIKNEINGAATTTEKQVVTEHHAEAKKNLAESEIPVLNSVAAKKSNAGNPWARFLLSLFIIAVVGGGLIVFSRWYGKNRKSAGTNNKIRMLTQFHIGPKKSLAIVQVAGESILIGVTDHNISMIKSLSLLDDEVPETAPQNFQSTLEKATPKRPARVQSEDEDEFVVSSIKDRITTKLKELRPL